MGGKPTSSRCSGVAFSRKRSISGVPPSCWNVTWPHQVRPAFLNPVWCEKRRPSLGTHGGTTVERVHRIDNRRTGFDGERDFVLVQIRDVLPAADASAPGISQRVNSCGTR